MDLMFKKGAFITQISHPDSFAIFGGDKFDSSVTGDGDAYSLICYHNPTHYSQDSNGKWISEGEVFEFDMGDENVCEYTIFCEDLNCWRECTYAEIKKHLQYLAEKKRLAWDEVKNEFRPLKPNETLRFDAPAKTNLKPPTYSGQYKSEEKKISLKIKEDAEQVGPIVTMCAEMKELIQTECERLKYSFYKGTYYQDQVQVPYRREYQGTYNGRVMPGGSNEPYGRNWHEREIWQGWCD